jgi:hypothetical protein
MTNQPWPPTSSASANLFIEKCISHSLLPLLFAESELPPIVERARDAVAGWDQIFAARARLFHDAIATICEIFANQSLMLIKGADYAHRLYPDRHLRAMQDIDVLVPAAEFESACRLVENAGLVPQRRIGVTRDPGYHERVFFLGNIIVEVHQSFVQRPRHRIDYDAIWQRRVPLEAEGHRVSRLDDVDALLYQALTLAIDRYHVRLIRFVDLWILLRQREGIALAAAERARDWQIARAFYGSLSLACRLFPEFRTPDVEAAMERALPSSTRRFVDRWVLPAPAEYLCTEPLPRMLQLWRAICLLDTFARIAGFARYRALALLRRRRFK